MDSKTTEEKLIDNGGRRKDSERRNFDYTAHIPERRSGEDRREGKERRAKRRSDEDNPEPTNPKK